MLDPAHPISVPELADVLVYADDRREERFYAMPSVPDVARSSDGAPEVSLLVHGRKVDGKFEATGALLSITTRFALSEAKTEKLREALRERLRRERRLPADARIDVEVASPDWTSGDVEVALGEGIVLRGVPSLIGGNETALTTTLDAEATRRLLRLWEKGLAGATIRYRLATQAARKSAPAGGESRTSSKVSKPGYEGIYEDRFRASIERTDAVPYPVEVQGPLRLAPSERRAARQDMAL